MGFLFAQNLLCGWLYFVQGRVLALNHFHSVETQKNRIEGGSDRLRGFSGWDLVEGIWWRGFGGGVSKGCLNGGNLYSVRLKEGV